MRWYFGQKAPEDVADMLKIMENSSTEASHGEKKLSQNRWQFSDSELLLEMHLPKFRTSAAMLLGMA